MAQTMKINCLQQDDKTTGWGVTLPDRTAHARCVWAAVCQNALKVTKGTFGGLLVAGLGVGARYNWSFSPIGTKPELIGGAWLDTVGKGPGPGLLPPIGAACLVQGR